MACLGNYSRVVGRVTRNYASLRSCCFRVSEISRRWIRDAATRGAPDDRFITAERLLPGAASSRCTMISGRSGAKPRHECIVLNAKWRGIRFLSDRQQEIYTIDHTRFLPFPPRFVASFAPYIPPFSIIIAPLSPRLSKLPSCFQYWVKKVTAYITCVCQTSSNCWKTFIEIDILPL